MRARQLVVLISVAAHVACGEDDEGPLCDPDAVESALARAEGGDTVQLGACRIEAALSVPPGVALVGAGVSETTIVGPEEGAAVELVPGTETRIEGVRIEANGQVGIVARGAGAVVLQDVTVEARRGVAVGIDGATDLTMSGVSLEGVVTADNATDPLFSNVAPSIEVASAPDPDCRPDPDGPDCADGETREVACPGCGAVTQACSDCGRWVTVAPTFGLVVLGVESAELTDVVVRGFAEYGAVFLDRTEAGQVLPGGGSVVWHGGEIAENMGVGLHAAGDLALDLEALSIVETQEGLRGVPAFGAVLLEGVDVRSSALEVARNTRYGMVHRGATALHDTLTANDNGDAAVWVGDSARCEIVGSTARGNSFAGIVVVDSSNITIRDTEVTDSLSTRRSLGLWGAVEIGDGIHLANSLQAVLLDAVTLRDNGRVGLLVDLGQDLDPTITFVDVTVSGQGDQLGAVAGALDADAHDLAPIGTGGWDDGIVREGATIDNDAVVAVPLDVAGTITPSDLPLPEELAGGVLPCD